MQRRNVLISVASTLASAPVSASLLTEPLQGRGARVIPATFSNQGVKLVGNFHLPPGELVGGIVLVHGSGPRLRINWAARHFADQGLAVLTYDKRGVGESGGTYEGMDNASHTNLALLAGDAAAGMDLLRRRPEVAGLKLGYWGISQAGWIIPLAVLQSAPIDFMVIWSGPVCTAAEQLESVVADGGNPELQAYADYLRSKGLDTDPRDALRRIDNQGLWVYGGKDNGRMVQLSIDRLKALIDGGRANFSYWLNSAAGHDDFGANPWFMNAATHWILAQTGRR